MELGRKHLAVGRALVLAVAILGAAGAPARAADTTGTPRLPDPAVHGCDVLLSAPVGHDCLLPWPNDAFTVAAPTTTGRRLDISPAVDPANTNGKHVDTNAQNRGDGFSPGSVILVYVPGLSI